MDKLDDLSGKMNFLAIAFLVIIFIPLRHLVPLLAVKLLDVEISLESYSLIIFVVIALLGLEYIIFRLQLDNWLQEVHCKINSGISIDLAINIANRTYRLISFLCKITKKLDLMSQAGR